MYYAQYVGINLCSIVSNIEQGLAIQQCLFQCHERRNDINKFIKAFGIVITVCHFTLTVVRLDRSAKE